MDISKLTDEQKAKFEGKTPEEILEIAKGRATRSPTRISKALPADGDTSSTARIAVTRTSSWSTAR